VQCCEAATRATDSAKPTSLQMDILLEKT
jgi:hypothetical protein